MFAECGRPIPALAASSFKWRVTLDAHGTGTGEQLQELVRHVQADAVVLDEEVPATWWRPEHENLVTLEQLDFPATIFYNKVRAEKNDLPRTGDSTQTGRSLAWHRQDLPGKGILIIRVWG